MNEDYDHIINRLSDAERILWRLTFGDWPPGTRLTPELLLLLDAHTRERVARRAEQERKEQAA